MYGTAVSFFHTLLHVYDTILIISSHIYKFTAKYQYLQGDICFIIRTYVAKKRDLEAKKSMFQFLPISRRSYSVSLAK